MANEKFYGKYAKYYDLVYFWKDYQKDPLFNSLLEESFMIFNRIGKITSGWLAGLHNAKGKFITYDNGKL